MVVSSFKNSPQVDRTAAKSLVDRELQQFAQAKLEGDAALAWLHLERDNGAMQ
jgi:hypothetical protein